MKAPFRCVIMMASQALAPLHRRLGPMPCQAPRENQNIEGLLAAGVRAQNDSPGSDRRPGVGVHEGHSVEPK